MEENIKCYYVGKRQKNSQCRCVNLIFGILATVLLFIIGILVGAIYSSTFLENMAVMYLASAIVGLMLLLVGIFRLCVCNYRT